MGQRVTVGRCHTRALIAGTFRVFAGRLAHTRLLAIGRYNARFWLAWMWGWVVRWAPHVSGYSKWGAG